MAAAFHSDNLELSEQFDATTGYEKSVSNLSWSYASYLSAVRARTPSENPGGRGGSGKDHRGSGAHRACLLVEVPHPDLDPAFLLAARRELVKTCTRRFRGNVRCLWRWP